MNKQRKPYKTYTREFKLEAVRLMEESDRRPSDIAMELGIRRNQLYKWKTQLETNDQWGQTRLILNITAKLLFWDPIQTIAD